MFDHNFMLYIIFFYFSPRVQQTKSAIEKVEDDVYEMSKPLARYKNDEDLDRMLRDRERSEDPMLAFLQKKKTKQDVIAGKKGTIKIILISSVLLSIYCINLHSY